MWGAIMNALEQLKALRRGKVHGGYRWMAVLSDGECICEACVTTEYQNLFRATYRAVKLGYSSLRSAWGVVGLINSGDTEDSISCVQCGRVYFEDQS